MAQIKIKEMLRRILVDGKKTKEAVVSDVNAIWKRLGGLSNEFEAKNHDWVVSQVVKNANFFLFDETADIDALPYGAQVKIKFDTTAQGEITAAGFADTDQVQSVDVSASGTHRFILNAAATDVLNYAEIKNDIDKYMIAYKMKGDGKGGVTNDDYWQFVRFEAEPALNPTPSSTTSGTVKTFTTGTVGSHIDEIIAAMEVGGNALFYRELAEAKHTGEVTGNKVVRTDDESIKQVLKLPSGNFAVISADWNSNPGLMKGHCTFYDKSFNEIGTPVVMNGFAVGQNGATLTDDGKIFCLSQGGIPLTITEAGVVTKFTTLPTGRYSKLHNIGGNRFLISKNRGAYGGSDDIITIDSNGKNIPNTISYTSGNESYVKISDDKFALLSASGIYRIINSATLAIELSVDLNKRNTHNFALMENGNFAVIVDNTSIMTIDQQGVEVVTPVNVSGTGSVLRVIIPIGDEILAPGDKIYRLDGSLNALGSVPAPGLTQVQSWTHAANGDAILGATKALIRIGGKTAAKRAAAPVNKNVEKIITADKLDTKVMVVQKSGTITDISAETLDATHTLKVIA